MSNFSNDAHKHDAEQLVDIPNQASAIELDCGEDALSPMRSLAQQASFIQLFKLESLGPNQAKIDLGQDSAQVTRIRVLEKAQELALALHGRPAVMPEELARWRKDSAFGFRFGESGVIAVNCNVAGSADLTRPELAPGLNNLDVCDLATLHAVHFAATGEDLFSGNLVRARNGTLGFNRNGLFVFSHLDSDRDEHQACLVSSQAIPWQG